MLDLTAAAIPVRDDLGFPIVLFHGTVDTILTGIVTACLCIEGPVRHIHAMKLIRLRTLLRQLRAEKLMPDPGLKERCRTPLIDIEGHHTPRCHDLLFLIAGFHHLRRPAVRTDIGDGIRIVHDLCATGLTDDRLRCRTPVGRRGVLLSGIGMLYRDESALIIDRAALLRFLLMLDRFGVITVWALQPTGRWIKFERSTTLRALSIRLLQGVRHRGLAIHGSGSTRAVRYIGIRLCCLHLCPSFLLICIESFPRMWNQRGISRNVSK